MQKKYNLYIQFIFAIVILFIGFFFFYPKTTLIITGGNKVLGAKVYLDGKHKGYMVKDPKENIIFGQDLFAYHYLLGHDSIKNAIPISVGTGKVEIKLITIDGEIYTYTAEYGEDVSYNLYDVKDFKKIK